MGQSDTSLASSPARGVSGAAAAAAHDGHGGLVHIMPVWLLAGVWLALMVLTYLTVKATAIDLGDFNLWLAMVIATIKATLVALYFMHLRHDKPFHIIVFVGALVFVMLFVSLTLMDTKEYQPLLDQGPAPKVRPL